MLGEGARTADDAERYFNSYARAIEAIGRAADDRPLPDRPGISVKLSALHPRFEAVSASRVMTELVPRLIDLARQARAHDLNFTVDAEEADRLELSLDVIAAAFADASLAGWDGFGLAIQAYQKRANDVIDYVDRLAHSLNRRMMVRLVKGAYWDTEIKRAQERGLDGYPVFTRKAMTDLNYIACARQLLGLRPRIFPQFATHNALTVATILELASSESGFEFQRLHGMGEALYAQLGEDRPDIACRTYAPVGSHRDLLAYLVRRLLENGANSSFVALAADETMPVAALLRRPAEIIGAAENARHPNIPLPRDLFSPQRENSRGIEFGERAALGKLVLAVAAEAAPATGSVAEATTEQANAAIAAAARDSRAGAARRRKRARKSCETRRRPAGAASRAFHRAAATRGRQDAGRCAVGTPRGRRLLPLLCRAGRKAVRRRRGDAGADRREQCARSARPRRLRRDLAVEFSAGDFSGPGHRGADGRQCRGRKTSRADAVDRGAKPISLLHEAGVPASALHLVQGDGRIGAALVAASRYRRRRLHRLDRSRARHQPARWPPRTARSCR